MNIGLLLPSAIMYETFNREKIFAPKDLFLALADGLVARGHRVCVYSSSDTKTHAKLVAGNDALALQEPPTMKIRYVGAETKKLYARRDARWEYELDLTSRAYKDAKDGQIEIIHSYLEFSAHYFSEISNVPTVYTLHDGLPSEESLDFWRLKRFPNDHYIAISSNQSTCLQKHLHIAGVVHHGINVSEFEANLDTGDYVLFIGRYMPEKGVDDAIRVGIETKTLTILAGSKEYREIGYYKEEITPFLTSEYIKEVGYLGGNKKVGLLGGAKVLLFPIHWEEPFGMVMIEAMASGTPVIAYNRGSVQEIVRDGVTGFIVDPDDTGDWVNKGNWVIKKTGIDGLVEAVKRIGEIDRKACRTHVEEHFTVERMVDGYVEVYRKILHK